VSHQPERKAKNCLNCGTTVVGRYCHVCGQENIETKESFWSLAKHFVFDIFHFDGKFFHTLKYIFIKPGLVAREYCLGKRISFLHPIRMYLFTSAIFFLVFFSLKNGNGLVISSDTTKPLTIAQRKQKIENYRETLKQNPKNSEKYLHRISLLEDTTKPLTYSILYEGDSTINVNGKDYSSVREYDSIQHASTSKEKDNWLARALSRKTIELNKKYHNNGIEMAKAIWETFLHKMPYMLFISLPFFALLLRLLYVRRKNFYYSDHAIFTIYHYILSFILLLIFFCISALQDKLGWRLLSYLIPVIFISWPLYLLLEMKNFYQQKWLKTIGKFLLLNFLGLIVIFILLVGFILFSVFEL
jgi:hypothetical protein